MELITRQLDFWSLDTNKAAKIAQFDGKTFDQKLDRKRLNSQLSLVMARMSDAKWRTLQEIKAGIPGVDYGTPIPGSEASISARLRDLRKVKFGGFVIERRRRGDGAKGLWEYRMK